MFPRIFRPFAAALLLAGAAAPAAAQNFSQSYQFIDAVKKADGAKVTKLIQESNGAIVNTRDKATGQTGLHVAAERGDATYVRFLLGKGASANITDDRGNTPMMVAIDKGFAEIVEILSRNGGDVNLANSAGETPLIRAVQVRNLDLVRTLLAAGADPDRADLLAGRSARDYAKLDTRSPAIAKVMAEATKVQRKAVSGPVLR